MSDNMTIKLLKSCDLDTRLSADGISVALNCVRNTPVSATLEKYLARHNELSGRFTKILSAYNANEDHSSSLAYSAARIATRLKLMGESDGRRIADILIDNCNDEIKSISKKMNECKYASEETLDAARTFVRLQQQFSDEMRGFL